MKKYDVTIKEIEIYRIEGVEAESEADAEDIAWGILETTGKDNYYVDSDGEADALEV